MAELNVEALKLIAIYLSNPVIDDDVRAATEKELVEQLSAIIAALEDRDRLRAACQQALEAIAPCVVGWDYPDVPPMPVWAKRLESVVPMLQEALGIQAALEGRDD